MVVTLTVTFIRVMQTGVRDITGVESRTKDIKWILCIWLRLKGKDTTLLIINNIDATLGTFCSLNLSHLA